MLYISNSRELISTSLLYVNKFKPWTKICCFLSNDTSFRRSPQSLHCTRRSSYSTVPRALYTSFIVFHSSSCFVLVVYRILQSLLIYALRSSYSTVPLALYISFILFHGPSCILHVVPVILQFLSFKNV